MVAVLYGEMGAGKTTFTKALCKVLCDGVNSPTFNLINEYRTDKGEVVTILIFTVLINLRILI
ncbi:hypothetical protein MASR1M46_13910 [Bacteroidales bacterium]